MKVYRVREYFISPVLGPKFAGEFIENHLLKHLTYNEKKKLDEVEFTTDYDLFGYGLIFYSKEIDFPETIPDETYSEMVCRMIEESKTCCNPDCECKKQN